MTIGREESQSLWQEEISFPFHPTLSSHQTADVCVIGAGIAGLTVAYQLLREGRSVVVLERGAIGQGQTGLTSAHLSNVLDEGFTELQRLHGKDGARLAAHSHGEAINEIQRICTRENIDCDFKRVDGYLFLGEGDGLDLLESELEASRESGLNGVEFEEGVRSPFPIGPALRYPAQAQFHPLRYLTGLADAVRRMGGKIFPHTEAQEVEGGKPARVTTQRGFQVVCGSIVVAANVPFNDRVTMHTKMAPYRTYVVGVQMESPQADALFWDTSDPYHYIRFAKDPKGKQIMIIGGEDHRTGQGRDEEEHYENLLNWAGKKLGYKPKAEFKWSGQVLEPHDGLAFIGHNPGDDENVYICTGDSGHGLTHGTIAGLLIKDLILKQENPWAELYEPSRVNLRGLGTYLKEVVNSTAPYSDWLTSGDVTSIADIPNGEGAVVRMGVQKVAAFKDSLGRVHMCSAVCPHLNGIVRWNSAEKTWDCPCHGSRFDRTGKVINGPAPTGLKEIADTSIREGESASA
jgi:glycine/D-amino acid oxidase-like deaminating enzyme/nitrite reductase/ring-hydroxylating ferredoxin subunit